MKTTFEHYSKLVHKYIVNKEFQNGICEADLEFFYCSSKLNITCCKLSKDKLMFLDSSRF